MRKLRTPILVVLLLFAGFALADPPQPPSGSAAAQPAAAQPAAPPPAAAQAAQTPMQPFTSTDGRFSAFFPGTLTLSSQPVHLKNGETTTLYEFSVSTSDDTASYMVMYNDYLPDAVADGAQALLQRTENGAVAGKTLLGDQVIDLRGVPGRAYTVTDANGYTYTVHEFLAGTRLYQLVVTTAKGSTATQLDQFMNSFIIL